MVGAVSSTASGGNFIFCWNFLKPLNVNIVQMCQICVENENLEYAQLHYNKY